MIARGNVSANEPGNQTVEPIIPSPPASECTGRRILLVDDEQEQLSLYEQALTHEEHEIFKNA